MIEIKGTIRRLKKSHISRKTVVDKNIFALCNKSLAAGKRRIKGFHGAYLGKTFLPYGENGFFFPIDKKTGVKVFYSITRNSIFSKQEVKLRFKQYQECQKLGLSPEVHELVKVRINILIMNRKKRVRKTVYGILIDRVHFPIEPMLQLAQGLLYDFDCLSRKQHPKHTSEQFLEFRQHVGQSLKGKKLRDIGKKIGDIIYCIERKQWILVDCG